jgi:hypothetical protein
MSTKTQRSEAAAMLGEVGGRARWADVPDQERSRYAEVIATIRWERYRRARAVAQGQPDANKADRSTL